ncbi:hypothetical protein KTR10_00975 [Candidatus Kaiserbacteria bacterium]|nr:hypothetical protein [Candidatus Kaiserbacteria bacterium]
MLSLFPSFLAFALLVPLILRITIGLYFLFTLRRLFANMSPILRWILQLLSCVASVSVLLGAYTQLGAIILAGISLFLFMYSGKEAKYFFLFIMSLALLFLGAGFFAFDLPI